MPNSNPDVRQIVIGTAGHVDHGKTALIRALTGVDTDRLAEEKRRGISIDLGFAHYTSPNGINASFVDVPGHEHFIKNMLAGAGGIEAVLLVVAADEGVKPQTREHFEICRLLGVKRGIIAVTKIDLASQEQIDNTQTQIDALRAESFLQKAPIVLVSALSGRGMSALVQALEQLCCTQTFTDRGSLVRLPIDRGFALKGFGTVVTGTLWGGELRTGDSVELQPLGVEARIRGLQIHGQPVTSAKQGQRTAVNLSGVEPTAIQRGLILTKPKQLLPTKRLQIAVEWLSGVELPTRREDLLLHIGTSEIAAHLKVLNGAFVECELESAAIALPGDRIILRRPTPAETIGGGTILDPFPAKQLNRFQTIKRLESLLAGGMETRLPLLVEEQSNGCTVESLVWKTGYSEDSLRGLIRASTNLLLTADDEHVVSQAWLNARRQQLVDFLTAFHAQNPSTPGAPLAQARLGLNLTLSNTIFQGFSAVRINGDLVCLNSHRAEIPPEELAQLGRIEQEFRKAGFQPSAPMDLLKRAAVPASKERGLLERLIKEGRLIRVSSSLVFHRDVLDHVRTSLAQQKGRRFSISEFKDWTQISRKYAIPLLEYLDYQRLTRRDGDCRVVL
jgi:selenocysteine-specific elongation factor